MYAYVPFLRILLINLILHHHFGPSLLPPISLLSVEYSSLTFLSDLHSIQSKERILEDADIESIRRKKFRLLTYHERFGHLNFAILKLLARCGITPRDLEKVDPPACPGCGYGKAHRRQWRHKGIKNIPTQFDFR